MSVWPGAIICPPFRLRLLLRYAGHLYAAYFADRPVADCWHFADLFCRGVARQAKIALHWLKRALSFDADATNNGAPIALCAAIRACDNYHRFVGSEAGLHLGKSLTHRCQHQPCGCSRNTDSQSHAQRIHPIPSEFVVIDRPVFVEQNVKDSALHVWLLKRLTHYVPHSASPLTIARA